VSYAAQLPGMDNLGTRCQIALHMAQHVLCSDVWKEALGIDCGFVQGVCADE